MLGLRDKHGCARLEAACDRALAVGDPIYRTIRGILAAGTDHDVQPTTRGNGAAAAGAFLRGPDQFGTDTGVTA